MQRVTALMGNVGPVVLQEIRDVVAIIIDV
jgi:hypothetical protein